MSKYIVKWTEVVEYWCEVEADNNDKAIEASISISENLIDNEMLDSGNRIAEYATF